jgi:outer membrane protein OmpA-like peptidoglycan-associated protein
MSRSASRPLARVTALLVAGLAVLVPGGARADPDGTASPEPLVASGPTVDAAQGAGVTAPVIDVVAPAVDVLVVTSDTAGDSSVAESPGHVELTLGTDVLFAFGKADLTPAANQRLKQVADRIRTQAKGVVSVDGHTDSVGSAADNLALSQRRAQAVHAALAALLTGTAVTFEVTGHGEAKPVAPNTKANGGDNPSGRAKNRRVEIRFDR